MVMQTQPDDDPVLDRCPHGRRASEPCPSCDGDSADDVVLWPAINPKALTMPGLLRRCPVCKAVVIDIDRETHMLAMHAGSADIVYLAEIAAEQQTAA